MSVASIRTAIELQDNFSNAFNSVINAVNTGLRAMEELNQAMNAPVDMSSVEDARNAMNQAASAAYELEAAMAGVNSTPVSVSQPDVPVTAAVRIADNINPAKNIPQTVPVNVVPTVVQQPEINVPEGLDIPVTPCITQQPEIQTPENITVPVEPVITAQPDINVLQNIDVPVTPYVTEQPQIDTPESISVPVTPYVTQQPQIETPESVDIPVSIDNEGIAESQRQIAELSGRLEEIARTQEAVRTVSGNLYILPDDAKKAVSDTNHEIRRMQAALEFIQTNPFSLDSSVAQLQIKSMSKALDEIGAKQRSLDESLGGAVSKAVNIEVTAPDPLIEQPSPVSVPVKWQTDLSPEVFTGSGIERFRQEVQSTNSMLSDLNSTQSRIASVAAQMQFLSPGAAADINSIGTRLSSIQQRIQQIENNKLNIGTDTANAELEQLRGQLGQALQAQQALNDAIESMDVSAANEAYLKLLQTIKNTQRCIRDNADAQGRFNQTIDEGKSSADGLMKSIKSAVAAYASIQTAGKIIELSDTMTQTTARLNLIVDDGGSVEELQNKIYASAQASRASYQSTADAIAKMGSNAGDAFSSNDELIAFMEQVNKQFTIAGTDAQGIDAAMLQLTQAMGSGVLRGEEFNSILEQAPNIIQSIADYMDVPKGALKDMAADGYVTAETVKSAMFAAADDTNAKFESMPMTFSQIWTSFQNTALIAFQPVLEKLNEIANSEGFQTFVENALGGLAAVAGVALQILDLLGSAAGFIADNWSLLSPIIYGVAAALAVYYGWQVAVKTIDAITKGIHIAMAAAQMMHAAATGALTAATAADIAAQNGLNAALYACPIVWILMIIIAVIAAIYVVVAIINKVAETTISATGIICGALTVAAAFIGNLFITLINFITDIFVVLWNFIASFANFFGNVFNDPVGAIARLFFDLVDTILSLLESVASAIDTIFGSNLASSVSGWRDSLTEWVDSTFGKGEEVMAKVNAEDYHVDRFEYKSAWDAGYNFGEGIDKKISNFDPSSLLDFGSENVPDPSDYTNQGNGGSGIDDLSGGVSDIADNTSDISDELSITEEDLKYLRDIAEQEAINRFTTAEITIEQTNHNNISSDMDLDGIVNGLTDAVDEAAVIIAEGVHV